MFSRQRTLLSIVEAAGGRTSHLHLTKCAFAVRQETGTRGGDSFYDFLPYKYGPFSFTLYQDAAKLCREGLLAEANGDTWILTDAGRSHAARVDQEIATDVRSVVSKLGRLPAAQLLRRKQLPPKGNLAARTAGYEGLSVDAFLNRLLERGIRRLIDVRHNPVARRYGFHGKTLAGLCGKIGIEYLHLPQLGIPGHLRRHLRGPDDYAALFADYDRYLDEHDDEVRRVAIFMKQKPSVLVCVEADPGRCHRSRLARRIAGITGLAIGDLGAG
ncbi:MAG: DUF488 family protein [Myxococcota bacterium]|nr:DUF488 family protein [Myxococcota bacterium]